MENYSKEGLTFEGEKMKRGAKSLRVGCMFLAIFFFLGGFALVISPVGAQAITVPIGVSPRDVAITPDGEYAYVTTMSANGGPGSLAVISTTTKTVTATVTVGVGPNHVAISPNGAYVYVTNSFGGSISVINTATNSVTATVHLTGEPAGVSVTPDDEFVYVTTGAGSVSVINATSNTVTATIAVGFYPLGVAITPDGAYAYVANYIDGTISVISTATNTVTSTITLPFDSRPVEVAVTPNGEYVYVTNQDSEASLVSTLVISTVTNKAVATVTGFSSPYAVAVSPNGTFAYVTNDGTGSIYAIDTSTNTVTQKICVGTNPGGMAIMPDSEYIYVTASNATFVINTRTLTASVSPSAMTIDATQSTTVSATAWGGSGSYTSYQWYVNGSEQKGQNASTFCFVPASAGLYAITATITDTSGTTSAQSNVSTSTVNIVPTVSISPVGPLTLPVGEVHMFSAITIGGSGNINYQWYLDGASVGTNSGSYTYISATGSHTVTCKVTDSAPIPISSFQSNAVSITASAVSGALAFENSWMEKVSIPTTTSGDETAFINGTIYIFGSTDYAYNPSANTLITIAPMPTPRITFAIASCGNKIYLIGGYDEKNVLTFSVNEVYDPSTNTWATVASMPTNRSEMQAEVVNNKIYVIGGRTADSYSTDINEIYNPAADSWTRAASSPYPVASAAYAIDNNKIYVIGGEDDNHPPAGSQNVAGVNSVNFNQIYNPSTDSWSLGNPIPTSTIAGGAGATKGANAPERIYVFGNIAGFLISSNQSYVYDPVANSWTSGAPMPFACASPAVAVVNDIFFVIGDGQNVEQYTPIGYSSATTIIATTETGASINFALGGNITDPQMSNITITTNQSNTTTIVSFNVTGQRGTTGFGNMTIPVSAVPFGVTPTIYIDNQLAQNQGYTKDANNYYVWFTTHFSKHEISIIFNTMPTQSPSPKPVYTQEHFPNTTGPAAAITGVSVVVIIVVLLVYFKKIKPRK